MCTKYGAIFYGQLTCYQKTKVTTDGKPSGAQLFRGQVKEDWFLVWNLMTNENVQKSYAIPVGKSNFLASIYMSTKSCILNVLNLLRQSEHGNVQCDAHI